jgi:hypothetical protein
MNCNVDQVSIIPAKLAKVIANQHEEFEIIEIQVPQEEPSEKLCGFYQLLNLKAIFEFFSRFPTTYIYEDIIINNSEYTRDCVKQFRASLYYNLKLLSYNNYLYSND